MTEFDRQRISFWIADAFAILCVRAGGGSAAENQVRLGFESILRQLGTSPLRIVARSVAPAGRLMPVSAADWRQIVHALERCRTILMRYETSLNAAERRTRDLIQTTQSFAQEELAGCSQPRERAVRARIGMPRRAAPAQRTLVAAGESV